jgi:uncharacterized membrane protein
MASVVTTFLRGLGVVVPVVFTIWLVYWLANGAETLLRDAFLFVLPANLYLPGLGLVTGILLVFAVGVLLRLFVIQQFWAWFERFLDRIPLVKTIYNSTRDFLGLFSTNVAARNSTVVRVGIAPGAELIGFVTDESSAPLAGLGADLVAVYLPMSYQLGGYTVLVPRDRVTALDWPIEEAMRFVLTAGIRRQNEGNRSERPRAGTVA